MRIFITLLMFFSCTAHAQSNPALLDAARKGDIEAVKKLLDQKVDVNAKDPLGGTALMAAAQYGHEKIVKMLLDSGADANHEAFGYSALVFAAWGGYKDIVSILIKKRVRICSMAAFLSGKGDRIGLTADKPESHFWDVEMADILIKNGANIREKDKHGRRPLTRAAREGNKDLAVLLIKAGADVNDADSDGFTPLMAASSIGNKDMVELLLASRAQVNKKSPRDGFTALTYAVTSPYQPDAVTRANKDEIAELLVKAGADVNVKSKNGDTPIIAAARYSIAKTVDLLIKAGADVNAKGDLDQTALLWLSFEYLLEIHSDTAEKAKLLIAASADINQTDTDGNTALIKASTYGDKELAYVLIKAGANLNAKDKKDGFTALLRASNRGHKEIAKMLVKAGADVNIKSNEGFTSLILIIKVGDPDIVKLMIEAGADVNAKSRSGSTPLNNATYYGYKEIAEILRKAGAL